MDLYVGTFSEKYSTSEYEIKDLSCKNKKIKINDNDIMVSLFLLTIFFLHDFQLYKKNVNSF